MLARILKTLALSLALGLVVAGSATASVFIDRADLGTAPSSKPIVSEKTAGLYPVVHPLLSEKLGGLQLQAQQTGTPIVSEKVGGLDLRPTEVGQVTATGGDFDWNDAGIGAGITFASLLLVSGAALTLRRHHGPLAH